VTPKNKRTIHEIYRKKGGRIKRAREKYTNNGLILKDIFQRERNEKHVFFKPLNKSRRLVNVT
jgi:hypothetical protein